MDDQKRRYLFEQLKTLLQGYGDVLELDSSPGKYSLSTTKQIIVDDEIHEGYQFVEIRELKNLVGFYYMPIHVCPELRDEVPTSMQAILKGNTCFNIKAFTPEIERGLKDLMKLGMDKYKENDWI
jgi:polyhydroxyalkanoate synthesis regulator protein